MLQTETKKSRREQCEAYINEHIVNHEVEWLIEHGKIREAVYFKGETGDRYTIYVATKRNKNIVDLCGKPLICWTIEQCLASKYIRDIWNTRSNECCIRFFHMEAKQVHSRRTHQGIKGEF